PMRTFGGTKLSYTLTSAGDRWDTAPYPPAKYDPAADLALVGQERAGAVDASRQATLLVLLLPSGEGSAVERAKAHLLARQKEVYEDTTLADATAPTDGVGTASGKVLTLRVTNT